MSDTGRWLVHWAINCHRARDLVLPQSSDSPAVMYAMMNLTTSLLKWTCWETTPILQLAPVLCLCARYLDRTMVIVLGAVVTPDYPFLSQYGDVPPQLLRNEHQDIRLWQRLPARCRSAGRCTHLGKSGHTVRLVHPSS